MQKGAVMKMEKDTTKKWIMTLEKAKESGKNAGLSESAIFKASKPRRQRVKVTLLKLQKYAKDNDNIIVPGKVLGTGKISKKFNISAIEYSKSSLERLKEAGCNIVDIKNMIEKDNLRILV